MKNYNKILIFLLTICILTSAFVFSVSAVEPVTDLTGTTWTLKSGKDFTGLPTSLVNVTVTYYSSYTHKASRLDETVYSTDPSITGCLRLSEGVDGNLVLKADSFTSITFHSGRDVKNSTLISWLLENMDMVVPTCDGSTCPATDMNADNICDDCGMTLSLSLTGYPELPFVSGMFKNSVVLQRDDGYFYMALTNDAPYSISGSVADNYLITVAQENEVSYVTYLCTDGKNWVHTNSGKAYSLSVGPSSATLLDSTFNWYKGGELFFQVPLWKEIQGVTQGELTQTTLPTTVGTMKTLVVCGVGLMACLVVLSLFGKVLGRYRKK